MRLFLALVASVLASPLAAETAPLIESFTLANGMEVVVIPNHRVPAVTHMLWIRVGSADDPLGKSGLAHFHEHMMFQGTPANPGSAYADRIAAAGGEQNAFTGYDATAYYITIAKDKLPLAMSLEADRMGALAPAAGVAEKEKQVIIEERRARIENNPTALFSEQINAALWRHHPYRLPVIGWMHEMNQLTEEDTLFFHRRWYHPNNAFLILSGDITTAEAKTLATRYYGSLPRGYVPKHNWTQEPPQNVARQLVMHHPNVRQPVWSRSYAASSLASGKTADGLPLIMLSQLLGNGKNSSLYRLLVVEEKLASAVDIDYDAFRIGPTSFVISVIPEPDVSMDDIQKAVDKEIARILKEGFNAEEMTRAASLLKAESIYARDGLESMARIMGWLRITGFETSYFVQWPRLIEGVTAAQVLDAARATLVPQQSVTGWLLPVEPREKE